MSKFEIEISCSLCPEAWKTTIDLPSGWVGRYPGVDVEDGFCPKHAAVAGFAESQCPGCVSGWGDCPLWQAFAYQTFTLADADMATIERGICPKRTNGTLSFSAATGMESIDISERAPTEAGAAFAQAIRDYQVTYAASREKNRAPWAS